VDPKAVLADDVKVGPFCIVGPDVSIGAGTELVAQCFVQGYISIGENNKFYPFASIGCPPQDLSWEGKKSFIKIGNNNTFREGVTVHSGTEENSETIIGDNCFMMNNSHVAHNCTIGNNVILINGAICGGYSVIFDNAILSANIAVHQFCRVGRLAMMAGLTAISKDLPPFMTCFSRSNSVRFINLVGMRRNGFSRQTIAAVKELFIIFYKSNLNTQSAVKKVEESDDLMKFSEVIEFLDFAKSTKRGILSGNENE
jgi:UDP-N-acetylglucosamine acyltransferase